MKRLLLVGIAVVLLASCSSTHPTTSAAWLSKLRQVGASCTKPVAPPWVDQYDPNAPHPPAPQSVSVCQFHRGSLQVYEFADSADRRRELRTGSIAFSCRSGATQYLIESGNLAIAQSNNFVTSRSAIHDAAKVVDAKPRKQICP